MKVFCSLLTLSLISFKLNAALFVESGKSPWGPDSTLVDLKQQHALAEDKSLLTLGQKSCRKMIQFFQVHISPIDGPRSSFYPTSSQYTLEAIQKYGVFRGIARGCDRLMRENGEIWVYERTQQYGNERKLDPVR